MPNDCFTGEWWYKTRDVDGNPVDFWGNPIPSWFEWTDMMGQRIDDQMCSVKEEAETDTAAAISAAIAAIPPPTSTPPTAGEVRTALGAPTAAITPQSGASLATVTVLGLTVLAASSADVITNMRTRIAELEARLKTLGLVS